MGNDVDDKVDGVTGDDNYDDGATGCNSKDYGE